MTADHVAAEHANGEAFFFHFDLDGNGVALRDVPTRARRVSFRPSVFCTSRELDVAFIHAPPDIVRLPGLRWVDLAEQAPAVARLPTHWAEARSMNATLPLVMLGFGNWTAVSDDAERWQLLSATPLQCDISAMDDPIVSPRAPQIWLDPWVTAGSDRDGSLQEAFFCDLLDAWDDAEMNLAALGGYSGGPIVWLTGLGEIVIGTVKDGAKWRDGGRVAATPIAASVDLLIKSIEKE